ncbi:MAG: copper-translocating P-type ATPase [Selenomonadales bacterium]|nr:heavy metal translocating P-type ATPase [Clostridiales bacterium]PWM01171.1 MAG: copper-translocating P-type ATPase [Selenomonadales bacterium]
MTCAACQANVSRCVSKLEGVEDVNVSLLANSMTVSYDESRLKPENIIEAVKAAGYGASSLEKAIKKEEGFRREWQLRREQAESNREGMKKRLIYSIILLVPLMYIAMGEMLSLPLPAIFKGTQNALVSALAQLILTVPVIFINRHFYQFGFKALFHGSPNMDSLVAIGSGASLLYGLFAMFRMAYGFGHGNIELVHEYAHALYFESAAMILTLVTVGKYLEARSKDKTSQALSRLMDLAPKTAMVLKNGEEVLIPAEQVSAGDIVIIRPGEGIPVDGVVLQGRGYVDQSAITGESIPVEKNPGDEVISATINKNGSFQFKASKVGEDTTLSQIIRLVDEAGNSKAPIARLADKVSGIFVPVVIGIALITAVIWLVAGKNFEFALSNAISVLVISCPCALGLATPVAIMVGTGKAAEMGILIKSAESLEELHNIDTLVLDKTGTITSGKPAVTDIVPLEEGLSEEELLILAASAEMGSEHPLAQAIVERAREKELALLEAESFEAEAGRGIRAQIKGENILAGNAAFMEENGLFNSQFSKEAAEKANNLAQAGKTPLIFAREGRLTGIIAVADTIRESSREAISRFAQMGLNVVMLTGDNKITAEAIKRELNISEAITDVLPTQKEAHIRALQEQGHKVAMVGDGINDAPALTRSDVGIAIGAGTDIAIESADVVLMKDSLNDVASAIELSRAVVRNIHMNLFWAFFYNILGIPLAAGALFPAFGLRLSPMIGSAAMSLSSVCVVANALRLRFFKAKDRNSVQSEEKQIMESKEEITAVQAEEKGANTMKKIIKVDGMMCAHCQEHVRKALAAVDGVQAVSVSLEEKQAEVTLSKDVPEQLLKDAVTEAGYTPVSCSEG